MAEHDLGEHSMGGWLRVRESQECLAGMVAVQSISSITCPSCGSVFVLHVCHAQPPTTRSR